MDREKVGKREEGRGKREEELGNGQDVVKRFVPKRPQARAPAPPVKTPIVPLQRGKLKYSDFDDARR